MKPFSTITTLTILFILSATNQSFSQRKKAPLKKPTELTGYIYKSYGVTEPFTYKLSRQIDTAGNYITLYKVFVEGEYDYDVFCTHFKSQKRIEVEVKLAGGGALAFVPEPQQTKYDIQIDGLFGREGLGRALFGDNTPNQLGLQFFDKT